MIAQHPTDSPEALTAIAAPEPKHVWINGSITLIYTGTDYTAPEVPSRVEMAQARLALLQSGLLATVEAALAGMPGPEGEAARTEWEYRSYVDRASPLVQSLAAGLGLSDAQLDGLFALAATL